MFLHFVGSTLLIGFVLNLILKLLAIPCGLFSAFLSRHESDRLAFWNGVITQVVLSLIYAGFIAVIAAAYSSSPYVTYSWVYAVVGFFVTYLGLGSNAHEKRKQLADVSLFTSPEGLGAVEGAGLGILAGLLAYPVIYTWPPLLTILPGALSLLLWSIQGAEWLMQFWLVRIILGLAVISYLLNAGMMALIGGAMLVVAAGSRLKHLFFSGNTSIAGSGTAAGLGPKTCPACGVINPGSALRCDCGFMFSDR